MIQNGQWILWLMVIVGVPWIAWLIWSVRERKVAVQCYRCLGGGMALPDEDFDCTNCEGTGMVIFKTHLSTETLNKHFTVIWIK
jgi:hypothetical protein